MLQLDLLPKKQLDPSFYNGVVFMKLYASDNELHIILLFKYMVLKYEKTHGLVKCTELPCCNSEASLSYTW